MRTDGIFSVHGVTVLVREDEPLVFAPFGDVHFDAPAHCPNKWREFCDWSSKQKHALFLGMGDYSDFYSTSERQILGGGLHESTTKRQEAEARARMLSFCQTIRHLRGKTVGILTGNHFCAFADGTTGDHIVAHQLDAPYLGVCAAIRIVLRDRRRRATAAAVDVFAHHGRGGGKTAHGRMSAVEDLARLADSDIYLMGDNHARGVLNLGQRLRLDDHGPRGLHLRSRQSWIARTGSFVKAYEPGEASYVVDRALPPASLGWINFLLTLRRERDRGIDRVRVKIEAVQ